MRLATISDLQTGVRFLIKPTGAALPLGGVVISCFGDEITYRCSHWGKGVTRKMPVKHFLGLEDVYIKPSFSDYFKEASTLA